jgi:predicted transcriptional regulator of viral defense system
LERAEETFEFLKQVGVARSRELVAAGFHRSALTRLVRKGQIRRFGRGLYALPEHDLGEWHDLAEIAKTIPSAVVALVSALAFHGIGTQRPYETWIALPVGARSPNTTHRLRITRRAEPYYSAGIEEHSIEGVTVRVYSAAKTVSDCFRMRGKVGYDVAVEALREGLQERKFTIDELTRYAKLDRVSRVIRPYLEALTT